MLCTSNSLMFIQFGYFLLGFLKFYSSTTWLTTVSDDEICLNRKIQNSEKVNWKHGIWEKMNQNLF